MLLTYYMWIKAVKTGSIYWSSICALAYFYMVSLGTAGAVPSICLRAAAKHAFDPRVASL